MATGWDGSKGVLDGSVGWGSIDRSIPGPPSGVKQAAYFIKMGYNTFGADTFDSDEASWPLGHYWGLLFGDTLPSSADQAEAAYQNFVGVCALTSSPAFAAVNAQNAAANSRQDYAGPFRAGNISGHAGSYLLGAPEAAPNINFLSYLSDVGVSDSKSDADMLFCIPRDPTINGTIVINIVASEVDETVTMEMWLSPEDIDFSAINFASIDLSNLASVFPNSAGWYNSFTVNGSAETGTHWRPESGVLGVPDRFVARYPMESQKMEIYNVAYAYGN